MKKFIAALFALGALLVYFVTRLSRGLAVEGAPQ